MGLKFSAAILVCLFVLLNINISVFAGSCRLDLTENNNQCNSLDENSCYCWNGGAKVTRREPRCDQCSYYDSDGARHCNYDRLEYSCNGYVDVNDCNADQCSGAACFLPGTKVSTPGGDRKIESLKPGDEVYSFNEATGKTVLNTVSDSIVKDSPNYYIIKTISGKEVKTTAEHPFFTGEKLGLLSYLLHPSNYTLVKDLKAGDTLFLEASKSLIPDKIASIEIIPKTQQVYNLHVKNAPNNFFAGGFAVHNKGNGIDAVVITPNNERLGPWTKFDGTCRMNYGTDGTEHSWWDDATATWRAVDVDLGNPRTITVDFRPEDKAVCDAKYEWGDWYQWTGGVLARQGTGTNHVSWNNDNLYINNSFIFNLKWPCPAPISPPNPKLSCSYSGDWMGEVFYNIRQNWDDVEFPACGGRPDEPFTSTIAQDSSYEVSPNTIRTNSLEHNYPSGDYVGSIDYTTNPTVYGKVTATDAKGKVSSIAPSTPLKPGWKNCVGCPKCVVGGDLATVEETFSGSGKYNIRVSWSGDGKAYSYRVNRCTGPGCTPSALFTSTDMDTTWVLDTNNEAGFSPDTTACYSVSPYGIDDSCTASPCSTFCATTPSALACDSPFCTNPVTDCPGGGVGWECFGGRCRNSQCVGNESCICEGASCDIKVGFTDGTKCRLVKINSLGLIINAGEVDCSI